MYVACRGRNYPIQGRRKMITKLEEMIQLWGLDGDEDLYVRAWIQIEECNVKVRAFYESPASYYVIKTI